MKKLISTTIIFFFICPFVFAEDNVVGLSKPVSLINLVATPEKYDGQEIAIWGWVTIKPNHRAIYFCRDRQVMGTGPDGIWLEFNSEIIEKQELSKYHGKFVMIRGVFNQNHHGHMGLFPGAIVEIENIVITDTAAELIDPANVQVEDSIKSASDS